MSFEKKGFSPAHINAGPLSPRIFTYFHKDDLLSEIIKPGYFNASKLILRPGSFIKVVCRDAVVELVIEKNTGEVTVRDEMSRFTDPYKDLIAGGKSRKPRKPGKKIELAKTG